MGTAVDSGGIQERDAGPEARFSGEDAASTSALAGEDTGLSKIPASLSLEPSTSFAATAKSNDMEDRKQAKPAREASGTESDRPGGSEQAQGRPLFSTCMSANLQNGTCRYKPSRTFSM